MSDRWRYSCLGCLGVAGVSLMVAGVAVAIGGYILQTHWEETVRATVAEETGGEVTFDHLLLGLGTVTITGPTLRGPDGVLLSASSVTATALPWTFESSTWALDAVEIEGLVGTLPGPKGLPPRTLALVEAGKGLPTIEIGTLTSAGATLHAGPVAIAWEDAEIAAVSVTPGEQAVRWGAMTAGPVTAATGVKREATSVTTFAAASGSWSRGAPLVLQDARLTGLDLQAGDAGWTVPSALLASLDMATAPEARIEGLNLVDVTLRASEVQTSLAAVHAATAGYANGRVEWGEAGADDIALQDDGHRILSATRATLGPGGWGGENQLHLVRLGLVGTRVELSRGQQRLGVPAAAWRLTALRSTNWGGVVIDTLDLQDVSSMVRSSAGDTETTHAHVVTHDVLALPGAPWWRIGATEVSGTSLKVEGRTFATARAVSMSAAGAVQIRGAEAWTRVLPDRTLEVPPIVALHTPTWLGGTFAGHAPFYDVSFEGLPYQPRTVTFTDTVVHLEDSVLADPAIAWTIQVDRGSVGPLTGETVALGLDAHVANGAIAVTGEVRPHGKIRADTRLDGIALDVLAPYLGAALRSAGLQVRGGLLAGTVTARLDGSVAAVDGDLDARDVQLGGGVLAGAANTGVRLTSGASRTFRFHLAAESDLADRKQHLVPRLATATVAGLLTGGAIGQVGGAVATTGGQVADTVAEKGSSALQSVKKALGGKKKKEP
jgi:hypothetical protein